MSTEYKGYRGEALAALENFQAPVWSDVRVVTGKGSYSGIVLPRSETADPRHIVLKLRSGYNIGIAAASVTAIEVLGRKEAHYKIPEKEFPFDPKKPRVKLLGTGGTIASRLDYRTGAVIPAFSPGELYGSVPELADLCNLETEKLYGVFSENMGPEQWIGTAQAIGREIERGYRASSSATAPIPCTTPPPSSPSWCRIPRCPSSWSARSAPRTAPPRMPPSTSCTASRPPPNRTSPR